MFTMPSDHARGHGVPDAAAELQAMLFPHASRLVAYVASLVPADVQRLIDPEDVVQDAMIEGICNAQTLVFDSPDQVWRWIALTARCRLINLVDKLRAHKRGGGRVHVYDGDGQHDSVIALLADLAVHQRTPSRSAARREFVLILKASMDRLPGNYRDAVRLRYIDGLSFKEAAGRLGGTEESTRKLCVRGLDALRRDLRSATRFL